MPEPAAQVETNPASPATQAMTQRHVPVWPMAVFLVLATIAVYWSATRCDFVTYDDHMYVLDNTHVTTGLTLENVRWAFRSDYAANWHPLTWVSHMLDCQMFGLKSWGHHLTSMLSHACNAALVFVLPQQLTSLRHAGVQGYTPASGFSEVVDSQTSVAASARQADATWRSLKVGQLLADL